MNFNFHSWAGIGAGILALIGFIPYIVSMVQGKNKPNRATWIIWGFLSVILLSSYKSAGATDAIWTSVSNSICMIVIVIFSLKYGEGGFNKLDIGCLMAAFVGLFFWWRFHSPLPALYTCIAVDFIGAIPTYKKAYYNPKNENSLTWILFWAANGLNLFAIHQWNFSMALYPLYLFFVSGSILGVLVFRNKILTRRELLKRAT